MVVGGFPLKARAKRWKRVGAVLAVPMWMLTMKTVSPLRLGAGTGDMQI